MMSFKDGLVRVKQIVCLVLLAVFCCSHVSADMYSMDKFSIEIPKTWEVTSTQIIKNTLGSVSINPKDESNESIINILSIVNLQDNFASFEARAQAVAKNLPAQITLSKPTQGNYGNYKALTSHANVKLGGNPFRLSVFSINRQGYNLLITELIKHDISDNKIKAMQQSFQTL